MADDSGFIFSSIFELFSILVNFVLRKPGYPEVAVRKLSVVIGWVFVAISVILLIWFTVSYS